MKLNNKGFALTSMIYMLIVLFLMIMLLVLSNLAQRKVVLDKITYDIKNKLDQGVVVNATELPYQNQTTGIYYETLQLAITKATSGDTIKVLKNVTDQSIPSIPQGKEIKIDIAGKEVTLSQMITNSGNLDIYTSEPGGIIYNSNQKTITNASTGTLTINDTNNINTLAIINTTTASESRVFVNEGNININNANVEIKNAPVVSNTLDNYIATNSGRIEVSNSNLTNITRETQHDLGLINISGHPNARIVFNSGTIRTSGTAIYNNGGTSSSFDDPVIEINGGTIVSTKYNAIRENLSGAYDVINGGDIYNENIPSGMVTIYMNGNLKVTGGTIYAYNGSGLSFYGNSNGSLIGGRIIKAKNPITNTMISNATINTFGTSNLLISGNAIIENESGNGSNVIYHTSTGTTTIDGNALVENKASVNTITIKSPGKILINNGRVKSNGSHAIINTYDNSTSSRYGTIEIKGGTVETTGEIAINTNSAYGRITIGTPGAASSTYPQITGTVKGSVATAGEIVINSGTITATTAAGVYTSAGTITVGQKTIGIPSTTAPIITGTTYGIDAQSGTINFYNGQITGATGKSISKAPTDIALGSKVVKTTSGSTETAQLNLMYVTSGAQAIYDAGTGETGTTWTPLVGNNATLNNTTWGANYIQLNGTNAWINLGILNSNYQTLDLTFSVDQMPTTTQYLIGNVESGGVGINLSKNGKLNGNFYINELSNYIYSGQSNTTLSTNTVYHVTSTYDGSNIKLYVNGALEKTEPASGNIKVPRNNTVMAIGTNPNGSSPTSPYLKGKIYSIATYNRALTAAEVYQNYVAGMHAAGITVN